MDGDRRHRYRVSVSSLSIRTTASEVERAPAAPEELGGAHDYLDRNREAWERWAPAQVASGRAAWSQDELRWGIWNMAESELRLLEGVPPRGDAVELGCGTAAISAWLTRRGMRAVAVDFSERQLATAAKLQLEFDLAFSLVRANGERVPFDDDSFDLAVSEYGVSLWSDPRNWLPEAQRLLRPGGRLVFFTSSALLMACTPDDGGLAGTTLVRDYFSKYRVEFPNDEGIEFHAPHGHWVRLLGANGFTLENLLEVRPQREATPRTSFVTTDWARRWPSEEIWIARKSG